MAAERSLYPVKIVLNKQRICSQWRDGEMAVEEDSQPQVWRITFYNYRDLTSWINSVIGMSGEFTVFVWFMSMKVLNMVCPRVITSVPCYSLQMWSREQRLNPYWSKMRRRQRMCGRLTFRKSSGSLERVGATIRGTALSVYGRLCGCGVTHVASCYIGVLCSAIWSAHTHTQSVPKLSWFATGSPLLSYLYTGWKWQIWALISA
jgi:hypothetical protein